jgi:hypothetical protein
VSFRIAKDEAIMAQWQFEDPPDLAVITLKKIIWEGDWIQTVTHDADDGGWQFLDNDQRSRKESDAAMVCLSEIVDLDPTIIELADLPLGWHAWRSSKDSPWHRQKWNLKKKSRGGNFGNWVGGHVFFLIFEF